MTGAEVGQRPTWRETEVTNSDRIVGESAESHVVLRNDEQQYSIWPGDTGIPGGWRQIGEPGPASHCVTTIEGMWTDMRPASARAVQASEGVRTGDHRAVRAGRLDQTVTDLIQAQAARTPNASAMISDEGSLSYASLDGRATRLAHRLREQGVRAESVVTVCMDRSADLIVALLAVLKAGGAFLPLDPDTPRQRLAQLVSDADSSIILSSSDHAQLFAGRKADVIDVADSPTGTSPEGAQPPAGPRPDDLAYMIYTSGSTGPAKGIMITNGSLAHALTVVAREYGLTPGDRVLHMAALGFDTSIEQIFVTLISGATLVLASRHAWAPTDLLLQLPERGITVADLTPAFWHRLLGILSPGESAVSSLRLVIVGGEIIHSKDCRLSLRKIPGARLINAYGLTETTITSTLCNLSEHLLADQDTAPAPVGRPLEGTRVYVLDGRLRPVPPRERGEVYIGGSHLARGIWKQPGLTARQFLPDPYGPTPGERMYRTGDVGRWRPDGKLEIIGRADDQIKIRGFRVDPAEVEAALVAQPGIGQAVVVARGRGDGERDLVACYTAVGPHRVDDARTIAEQLRSALSETLPGYMVPKTFIAVDHMPLTLNGKIDRAALPQPDVVPTRPDAEPRASVYAGMSQLWSQILGVESTRADDDFFELGGNSLLAMEMLARARIMFGIGVSQIRELTRSLLHDSALAAFAECAERARAGTLVSADHRDVDFESETGLRVSVHRNGSHPPNWRQPTDILLTGATGFCGAHLIDALLKQTTGRIHCLVRASDSDQAWERIRAVYQRYLLRDLATSRINPIVGDLSEPNLGLPPGTFESLGSTIDTIYHLGGQVNFIYPYHDLRGANVEGTREIIRLAASRAIPVHYTSSMAVFSGFGPAGVREVTEDTPLAFADYLSVGYVESKWVSEILLQKAFGEGLPIAIYRLNDVTGSSETGVMNTATEICALIRYIADSGSCPDIDLPLDFLPAECFALAVTHISTHRPAEGIAYHLTNPRPTLVGSLADSLRRRGYAVEQTRYSKWVTDLIHYAAGHPAHPMTPFVPLFVDRCRGADITVSEMYFKSTFPNFTRRNADRALEGSGIEIPPVDAKLLDRYLDFLQLSGYLAEG
ncbi:amino acid adenylation domain-containing protein/thioester reductase-like protein [Streptacidiphilus sp. MAP12-16]|uniref:amino acid adenylation domain-containing protein n=1 Tax=Streptacidiphilus sp. MAP12-16 TaxID=3156300 RepID=UPI003514E270